MLNRGVVVRRRDWSSATGLALTMLLAALFASTQAINKNFAGPFEMTLKRMDLCPDQGEGTLRLSTRINKISRVKYLYSSNISLPYDLDDLVKMDMNLAVMGNGGWKDNFYHWVVDCQASLTLFPKHMKKLLDNIGLPAKCPIPKGLHMVKNLPINLDINMPMFPYGEYRAALNFLRNGTTFGCFRMYVDVTPKDKKPRI